MDFLIFIGLVDLLMGVEGVLPGRGGCGSHVPGIALLVTNYSVVVVVLAMGENSSANVCVIVLADHDDRKLEKRVFFCLQLEEDGGRKVFPTNSSINSTWIRRIFSGLQHMNICSY